MGEYGSSFGSVPLLVCRSLRLWVGLPHVRQYNYVLHVKGREQGTDPVPHNLNTKANQQKRRKPYNHSHSVFPITRASWSAKP
jgi:hypothetical protein